MKDPKPPRPRHVFVIVNFAYRIHRDLLRGIIDYAVDKPHWQLSYGQFVGTAAKPVSIVGTPVPMIVAGKHFRPDGVIGLISPEHYAAMKAISVHRMISAASNYATPKMARVIADNESAGRRTAAHLIAQGFSRLAFYHQEPLSDWGAGFRARHAAVVSEAAKHDIPVEMVPTGSAMAPWLKNVAKPIGVIAAVDISAVELMQAARLLGIHIPGDIAVVGMNNDELVCSMVRPTLSSIDMNFTGIGFECARLMDRWFAGQAPAKRDVVIPPLELVRRGSSDVVLSSDPVVAGAMRYILQHAHEPIGVTQIATELAIGMSTLELAFRRWRKTTPLAELTRVRLDRAQRMLAETNRSVETIARACGFSSYRILSRWFKLKLGQTPSDFRETHRNDHPMQSEQM